MPLFRLAFVATQTNIVLIGNVGVGKTHLAIALGHAACLNGHSVLFTTAGDIINTLAAAQAVGQLKREFHHYLKAAILIVDGFCQNLRQLMPVADSPPLGE
jgi:DNA replication protein DnaC